MNATTNTATDRIASMIARVDFASRWKQGAFDVVPHGRYTFEVEVSSTASSFGNERRVVVTVSQAFTGDRDATGRMLSAQIVATLVMIGEVGEGLREVQQYRRDADVRGDADLHAEELIDAARRAIAAAFVK